MLVRWCSCCQAGLNLDVHLLYYCGNGTYVNSGANCISGLRPVALDTKPEPKHLNTAQVISTIDQVIFQFSLV